MFGGGRPVQYQQADHPYMPTLANTCGKCAKPNWPTHDTRVVPDANGCLYNHENLVTGLIKTKDGEAWRRCPGCQLLVEQHYPSIGAQGNQYEKGRGSLTARQQDRLKAWLGWWKWNGGDE